MSTTGGSEAIRVCIRIRPPVSRERGGGRGGVVARSEKTVEAYGSDGKQQLFSCNNVFPPSSSQEDVFSNCGARELIQASMQGYYSTLFAYGPTGCGKTFTVLGEKSARARGDGGEEGIVPRSIRETFSLAQAMPSRDVRLRVSVLEIYRDTIHDLLVPSADRVSLQCREHTKYGFFVDGLELLPCRNVEETLASVVSSLRDRHTAAHTMNEKSSRSHAILTLHIDSLPRKPAKEGDSVATTPPTYGSTMFVDLAGSERPKETSSSGSTLREAGHINFSLFVLSKVIRRMSTKGQRGKIGVPFRDTALTKLLIGSLGGNSKTLMFACVAPTVASVPETLRTLQFAGQVAGIQNRPLIRLDPREKLIQDLRCPSWTLHLPHFQSKPW